MALFFCCQLWFPVCYIPSTQFVPLNSGHNTLFISFQTLNSFLIHSLNLLLATIQALNSFRDQALNIYPWDCIWCRWWIRFLSSVQRGRYITQNANTILLICIGHLELTFRPFSGSDTTGCYTWFILQVSAVPNPSEICVIENYLTRINSCEQSQGGQ